jgi:5-methylcytosine-specific restriction endonuclease McrA
VSEASYEMRVLIKQRDNWACRVCRSSERLEVHHILFRSRGGDHDDTNLITLCGAHHMAAHQSKIAPAHLFMLVDSGKCGWPSDERFF